MVRWCFFSVRNMFLTYIMFARLFCHKLLYLSSQTFICSFELNHLTSKIQWYLRRAMHLTWSRKMSHHESKSIVMCTMLESSPNLHPLPYLQLAHPCHVTQFAGFLKFTAFLWELIKNPVKMTGGVNYRIGGGGSFRKWIKNKIKNEKPIFIVSVTMRLLFQSTRAFPVSYCEIYWLLIP